MRKIAIITARGGSKRIPRKNIQEFCGKPILAYSIEAALKSAMFDMVMVSTDDQEIAEIALKYGAEVPFYRSVETSGDYATTTDVLYEVLLKFKRQRQLFDIACCIYPTAPFLTPDKIRTAVELLILKEADGVLPVVKFSFPPQRSMVKENEFVKFRWPEYALARSQDLEPFYHDAGQFYCIRVDKFLETKKLIMDKTISVEFPELEVQDIDNEEDWQIAEMKYKMKEDLFKKNFFQERR